MKRVLPLAVILCAGIVLSSAAIAGPADNNDVRFAAHIVIQPAGRGVPADPCPIATGTPGDGSSYDPNHWDHTLAAAGALPCSQYNVVDGLGVYNASPWVYIVAGQGGSVGINGVSFGIDYKVGTGPYGNNEQPDPGIGDGYMTSQAEFALCKDGLDFPNAGVNGLFPNPKGGIRVTWSTCQNQEIAPDGVHAVIAKFYVYAYTSDVLELTPNNNLASGPELDVSDCGGNVTKLLSLAHPSVVPQMLGKAQFGRGRDGLVGYTPCGVLDAAPATWGQLKTLYEGSE